MKKKNYAKLVQLIKENQTLNHVDLNKLFVSGVNASKSDIESTLLQGENIIGFHNTSFKKHELNYTISDNNLYRF